MRNSKEILGPLKEINKEWKRLKEDPSIERCLDKYDSKLIFNIEKWLRYSNYINRLKRIRGFIEFKQVILTREFVFLKYKYYNPHKGKFENLERRVPRFFELDDPEFAYWLGLWIGDKFRVGISNKNKEIIRWARYFLENKLKQPQEYMLGEIQYTPGITQEELYVAEEFFHTLNLAKIRKRIDKRLTRGTVIKKKDTLAYAILLSNNYILFHIFSFLERKIWELISSLSKEARFAFYAGLIDAEGHVDKTHISIDIFQKDKKMLNNLKKALEHDRFYVKLHLKTHNRFVRIYLRNTDNLSMIRYLHQFLIHTEKIKDLEQILQGNLVKESYVLILEWIKLNPGKRYSDVASAFLQNHEYFRSSKIKQLAKQQYVHESKKKGPTIYYCISMKGEEWLKENKDIMNKLLEEIAKYGSANHGMYNQEMPAIKFLLNQTNI